MIKKNFVITCASLISISILLSGCAGVNRQVKETLARGTIEAGGYTWQIPAESVGGNSIETHGLPSKQAATEASDILCKKNDRVAQFVEQKSKLILGIQQFRFNCVK